MKRWPRTRLAAAGAERSRRPIFVGAAAVLLGLCLTLAPAVAQIPDKTPKADAGKAKVPPKPPDTVKPEPAPKPAEPRLKLPPGTIGLVFDSVEKALKQLPDLVILSPKEYQALLNEIEALKKKAVPERQRVRSCILTGRLEDNYVLLRAELVIVTEDPQTIVPLGLQGAVPTDEGDVDPQNLSLEDSSDDGLFFRVAKPGTYRPVLNLRAKVEPRRTGGERGFTLGLPGAAVTKLTLDLPAGIKEIRWNDVLEKPRSPGHWEFFKSGVKQLDVSWKERTVQPGSGPLLTADALVKVKLEETLTRIDAEITLEDLRGQAKEWILTVPEKAKVDMFKAPVGLLYDIQPLNPDANKNHPYMIRFTEPTGERFTVSVQMFVPRPAGGFVPKLAVGPFFVASAFSQRGTIIVQAKPSSLRGQRLIFHRFGDVAQREVGKGPDAAETVAVFQYSIPKGAPAQKAPLEIEWRPEKGLVETFVEQQLLLRRGSGGLVVDSFTHMKVKLLSASVDFLDVQLPRVHVPQAELFGWFPAAGFPGGVAWAGLAQCMPTDVVYAQPIAEFLCQDENGNSATEMSQPDAQGKARIKFLRPPMGKEFVLTLEGHYLVQGQVSQGKSQRLKIELPRPLGILDRGGKVTVSANDPNQVELLEGPASAEEPAPPGQSISPGLDPVTNSAEFAWRPFHAQRPALNWTDVILHSKHAHLREQISMPGIGRLLRPAGDNGHIRLRVPAAALNLTVISGGTLLPRNKDVDKDYASVNPDPSFLEGKPMVVEFDLPLNAKEGAALLWKVPLVWPTDAQQLEAKVRVWSEPGVMPQPVNLGDVWQDIGSDEPVAGHHSLPVLVLQGAGKDLPLTLKLPPPAAGELPLFVCDRGLIQVFVDEAGNHTFHARYLISKLNGNTLDVEFPVPIESCTPLPQISAMKFADATAGAGKALRINYAKERKVARLDLGAAIFRENMLLDIEFMVPAHLIEGNSWQTKLAGPVLRGGEFLGRLRWSVSLPPNWVSVVAGSDVRQSFRWSFQRGLLTPEPDVNNADLEKWLTNRDTADNGVLLSQVFGRPNQEPILIIHFTQSTWLLVCSGTLLGLCLLLFLAPLRRSVFWVIVVGLGLALVSAGLIWPTWVPPLFLGMQPALVILLLLGAVEWMRHERYRRQIVFMPGFTRVKPGSSLLKPSVSAPVSRPREASTIDAPVALNLPGRGSSVKGTKE